MTDRAAALEGRGQWPEWAGRNRLDFLLMRNAAGRHLVKRALFHISLHVARMTANGFGQDDRPWEASGDPQEPKRRSSEIEAWLVVNLCVGIAPVTVTRMGRSWWFGRPCS